METTSAAAAPALEGALTRAELELARLYIQQTRNYAVGAIKCLSEGQWSYKPAANVWSVAEIVEHVVTVQKIVLGRVLAQLPAAPAPPAGRDCRLVDSIVITQLPNRLGKFPSPEITHPKGGVNKCEGLESLIAAAAQLTACLESTPELRLHALEAPPLKAVTKGEHQVMDGYQWILAAGAHTERHTKQILEVIADPNFPA